MSELLGVAATRNMILSAMKEAIVIAPSRTELVIIDVTWDQKWHQLKVHIVAQKVYGTEAGGIEPL